MKSFQELYDDAKNEIQNQDPTLTDFNEGSVLDVLCGAFATAVMEIQKLALEEFKKTFVETADGPEVTGGADDLERLLVDHFGSEFARPQAAKATGTVTFSRASTTAGDVTILAGTIVNTPKNAAGSSQRYETIATVVMTGTTINASVRAVVAGAAGNADAAEVSQIETSLTDSSVTVTNAAAFGGGTDEATDSQYREFARNQLVSLRGATLASVIAAAKAVSGVDTAVGIETILTVKEWDEATSTTSGDAFKLTRVKLYVADVNGTASTQLLSDVAAAIEPVRACGVRIEVEAAVGVAQNITLALTFNVSGPNYATLSIDPQPILDDVTVFLQNLNIGDDLIRADLKSYILAKWGAAGTNDLTDLTIVTPVGDVSFSATQKVVPGTIGVQ